MALSRFRLASSPLLSKIATSTPRFLSTSSFGFTDEIQANARAAARDRIMNHLLTEDVNTEVGSCMPISMMRIGTIIHNIELKPNEGAKLVRGFGTSAKILKEPKSAYVLVELPSKAKKLVDTRCRATIGSVGNAKHKLLKLYKAGQNRWRGIRPHVRGVAMNPVDHPHGGGEGKSKSSGSKGRTSQTPWGKPCKCGYKTGPLKRRK